MGGTVPENSDDEINVEGMALMIAAAYPFEDPAACRVIHQQVWSHVEVSLRQWAARHPPPRTD